MSLTTRKLVALEPALRALFSTQRNYELARALVPLMTRCWAELEKFREAQKQFTRMYGQDMGSNRYEIKTKEQAGKFNAAVDRIADTDLTLAISIDAGILQRSTISAQEVDMLQHLVVIEP